MGIINEALSHLVAWLEKHVEKLAAGHAETCTNLLKAETDYKEAMEAYIAFVTVEPFLSLATKQNQAKTVTGDAKELVEEEIKCIEDEFRVLMTRRKMQKVSRWQQERNTLKCNQRGGNWTQALCTFLKKHWKKWEPKGLLTMVVISKAILPIL